MKKSILIVDDQIKVCRSLSMNLEDLGHQCLFAQCSSEALDLTKNHSFDFILLDLALGGESGMDLLSLLLQQQPQLNIIMMTGYGTISEGVKAIKIGALDFIQKPLDMQHLKILLDGETQTSRSQTHTTSPDAKLNHINTNHSKLNKECSEIITADPNFLNLLNKAQKLAKSQLPILILGESGTGKELMARQLHSTSDYSSKELFQVNCASFTESLLESELFGHEKGAFTGAHETRQGLFETANGSTLHLDEIGDMALNTQAKILRVLQEGDVKKVGSQNTKHVDLRIIASTHANLKEMIDAGTFRKDLYFRLSAAIIMIPPLRERPCDIPLLAEHFLKRDHPSLSISKQAIQRLQEHPWPGNVRELKNAISFAAALCQDQIITPEDFPTDLQTPSQDVVDLNHTPLEQSERQTIEAVYRQSGFNKKKTAEQLGLTRATLYKRLEKYGIG